MDASSFEELKRQLLDEMTKAMSEVATLADEDMINATDYFYAGGSPKMYHRTGMLDTTPSLTDIKRMGNMITFDAYLDQNYAYSTGLKPSMGDVLNLANDGKTNSSVGKLRSTVGNQHFWEKAEDDISRNLNKVMTRHFGW